MFTKTSETSFHTKKNYDSMCLKNIQVNQNKTFVPLSL